MIFVARDLPVAEQLVLLPHHHAPTNQWGLPEGANFLAPARATPPSVGPGTYKPLLTKDGESDTIARKVKAVAVTQSASVTSESSRTKLEDLW